MYLVFPGEAEDPEDHESNSQVFICASDLRILSIILYSACCELIKVGT